MTVSSIRPAHRDAEEPAAGELADAGSGAPAPAAPGAASYERLGELFPALRIHSGPPRRGEGWLAGADLVADPAALRELIDHDARQGLAHYGRPLRPDVAAGFGLHRFCWPAALLFTLPWFLERRVPLLTPADLSMRRHTGELTVRPTVFACLPDDPAAGLPGARPVADEDELRALLRSALTDFLTPLLTAFRPQVRRGPSTLWAMATDSLVEGLGHVAALLGDEQRARTELEALLAPGCAPLTAGTGYGPEAPGTPGAADRARASCCLVYTVRSEDACGGCPRVTRG
ncbi:(2Fe-2S)-binding protein [Kitasatospora sp. NPDC054939]